MPSNPHNHVIASLITRCQVDLVEDFDGLTKLQVTILDDELQSNVENLQQFGFSSKPPPGSEGVTLSVMGHSAHRVALCVDNRDFHPDDELDGESTHYNAFGAQSRLTADNWLEVRGIQGVRYIMAGGTVEFTAGNMTASGNVSDANGSMQEMRGIYNGHGHPGASGPPNNQMT